MKPERDEFLQSFSRAFIFGGGSSGASAAALLKKFGKKIILIDKKETANGIFDEVYSDEKIPPMDKHSLIVKSPGIRPDHLILTEARSKEIPVISEIDLGVIFFAGKIIGITGTDGKSTTTSLVWHLIQNDFPKSKAGGNLGPPFTSFCEDNLDLAVLELSSYQLDDSLPIDFAACSILNLAPDHLERHGTMENYLTAKLKILGYKNRRTTFVTGQILAEKFSDYDLNCIQKAFGYNSMADAKIILDKNQITTEKAVYSTEKFSLKGKHNLENLAASILIAESIGCNPSRLQAQIQTFKGLPHRFEFIRKIGEIEFINDSKSTNLHSMIAGLKGFNEDIPIVLVLGGIPKKEDISPMLQRLKQLNLVVFLYGEASQAWASPLGEILGKKLVVKENLVEVMSEGYTVAENIHARYFIFSPACASFDQYKNFEERGEHFKALVSSL